MTGGSEMNGGLSSFTIERVEAFHVIAPSDNYWRGYQVENRKSTPRFELKPGWRTVYGTRIETALVKVTLADGSVGWGEATEPICPEVICRLAVGLLSPLVVGSPFETPAALWRFCYDLNRGRGHLAGYHLLAMAALDIAVCDALAHRAGAPLAALAGETPAKHVPIYLSGIRRGTIEERIEALRSHVEGGLNAAKIFVNADTGKTMREVAALREGVGGEWQLMVDALWSYERHVDAAKLRQELAAFDVRWLECPLVPEDLGAHLALAAHPGVPIALGEHFFTGHQSQAWIDAGAVNVFQPDIGRTGFSNGRSQASYAKNAGIVVTPHMGTGSPIVQAAALHFWAAYCGEVPCEYQLDMATLLPGVFETGWKYESGRLTMPDRPGLGVTVNEAELHRFCDSSERSS